MIAIQVIGGIWAFAFGVSAILGVGLTLRSIINGTEDSAEYNEE